MLGAFLAAFTLVVAASPLQVLAGSQGAVRHDHAYVGLRFGVQFSAACVEQRGYVLVRCQVPSCPDLVAFLAHLPKFCPNDVCALAVGQPGRVSDDAVDFLLGDHCGSDHIPDVVCPHVVAFGGVQFSHRGCDSLDTSSGGITHIESVGDVFCVPAFVYGGCQFGDELVNVCLVACQFLGDAEDDGFCMLRENFAGFQFDG